MTFQENELINKRHFEEVGEAYASVPRLRNLIVKLRLCRVRFLMNSNATAWPCSFEMTLRENELVHKRHFEEVGEAYASVPRLRNLIVKLRL